MDLTEVVTRLVGPVIPIGDSHVDVIRQANLQALCALTGELMDRIEQVANMPKDYRASVNKSKGIADAFLAEIRLRRFAADVEAAYKDCSYPTCGCEEGQCKADEFNDKGAYSQILVQKSSPNGPEPTIGGHLPRKLDTLTDREAARLARPPSDEEPWVVADDTGLRVTFNEEDAAWRYRNEYTNRLVNPTVTHEPATTDAALSTVNAKDWR